MAGYVASPAVAIVHPAGTAPDEHALRFPATSSAGVAHPGDVLLRLPAEVDAQLRWDFTVAFGAGVVAGQPLVEWLVETHRLISREVLPVFTGMVPGL